MFRSKRLCQALLGLGAERSTAINILEMTKVFDRLLGGAQAPDSELEALFSEYDLALSRIKSPYGNNLLHELGSEDSAVTFREGIEYVTNYAEQTPGSILGVTGMPSVGKTFFINSFQRYEQIKIIDEFWDPECPHPGEYHEKVKNAKIAAGDGKLVLVSAPQLDRELVKETIHLVTNDYNRKKNIMRRIDMSELLFYQDMDFKRITNPNLLDRFEKIMYDIERYYSKLIVSTSPPSLNPGVRSFLELIAKKNLGIHPRSEEMSRYLMMVSMDS